MAKLTVDVDDQIQAEVVSVLADVGATIPQAVEVFLKDFIEASRYLPHLLGDYAEFAMGKKLNVVRPLNVDRPDDEEPTSRSAASGGPGDNDVPTG
jgi:hypothetical protein